ncbi:MAG: pyridoxine 5'-phosphate synthase [Deltaproteobacteria bacterium]|nr:pyridoxine 5'-phosphate synthase [Deltaproteobacteria bacterium]
MVKLGVNIDHVATVRQARGISEPDPVNAAVLAELGGADGITVHLREDHRHIQERDVRLLQETIKTRLNLELALAPEILDFALQIKPYAATFVPEKREELTTEGGLDVIGHRLKLEPVVKKFQDAGIVVSLFIDPDLDQIEAAASIGAQFIEIHTGRYCDAQSEDDLKKEFSLIDLACITASNLGLRINAGHGLNYRNVIPIANLPGLEELNIGHSIIGHAIFVGLERAVREMKALLP